MNKNIIKFKFTVFKYSKKKKKKKRIIPRRNEWELPNSMKKKYKVRTSIYIYMNIK